MDMAQRFQSELAFLREQGKEFVLQNPKLANFLSEESSDPDVERLLEGFAFLTARLRSKIEDEFPELTHSIINLLWPNYLRPTPSMVMMKFDPVKSSITGHHTVEKGTVLKTSKVENTICEFRTSSDIPVHPLEICDLHVTHTQKSSTLDLTFEVYDEIAVADIDCNYIDLFFGDDYASASTLYLWFCRYLKSVDFTFYSAVLDDAGDVTDLIEEGSSSIPANSIVPLGFSENESLLPYDKNAFQGYRILHEFFAFPEKYLFLRLNNLDNVWVNKKAKQFKVKFTFNRPFPDFIRLREQSIQLHCCPAINLFEKSADPINMDGRRLDYKILPDATKADHYEVFSIDKVDGWNKTKGGALAHDDDKNYKAFESFEHDVEQADTRSVIYYRARVREALQYQGLSHRIAFILEDESLAVNGSDTISLDLTCSNRDLPTDLGIGDICHTTDETPSYVTFRNITKPTESIAPILDGSLHWRLISNLSLNYISLIDKKSLLTILSAYDFHSQWNRQAECAAQHRFEGLVSIETEPTDVLFKGLPVRGLRTELVLDEEHFLSEGDLYIFASVLAEFFALYASINSFHILNVTNSKNGEVYVWSAKLGQQPLI